jgi:hypothetical protein
MFKRVLSIIGILMLLWMPFILKADPGDPGGGPGTPLDGGLLTILIGSGIVYLGKKYKERHKKGNE